MRAMTCCWAGPGIDLLDGGPGSNIVIQDIATGDRSTGRRRRDAVQRLEWQREHRHFRLTPSACCFSSDVPNSTSELNAVERIQFNALGGQDNIEVHDLSGTDVKHGGGRSRAPGTPGGGDGQLIASPLTGRQAMIPLACPNPAVR